jgi:predicted lipid-binding transport protein (Tim44 family)
MDIINVILLAVAAIVAWRFWSVLGTRTGFEKPPVQLKPVPQQQPAEATSAVLDGEVLPPEAQKPIWFGHAAEGSDIAKGLEAISARTLGFNVNSFLQGAKSAYEMVLEAFATGDKATLKNLLSKDLLADFVADIDARLAAERSMKFQFVGVKSADIKSASLTGNKSRLQIAFVSDMISATLDKAETVVEGDATAIRTVTDLWTFERDVTSRDPNWKLVDAQDGD